MNARGAALVAIALLVVPTLLPVASAERGPPFVPDLPAPAGPAADSAWENVTNTFFRAIGTTPVLFHEGFEGPLTLEQRGWAEDVLGRGNNAVPIWSIERQNETRRAQGERTAIVAAGEAAATVAGAYAPSRESRLVTPPIDLRYVVGASGSTDPADAQLPRRVDGQPTLTDVIATAKDALYRRAAESAAKDFARAIDGLDRSPSERALVSDREGVGLVNLTFFHFWDLANGDKAWVDIRTLENGTWSAWTPLAGDLVFETEVDYATVYQNSAYCDLHRGLPRSTSLGTGMLRQAPTGEFCEDSRLARNTAFGLAGIEEPFGFGIEDGGRVGPNLFTFRNTPGANPASLSALLETALVGGQYPPAYYNGIAEHEGNTIRAWNGTSQDIDGSMMIRKAHFTLNRFIGKEVQIGFHIRSGPATAGQLGWYLDEVQVTASVPDRDPAVNKIASPGRGDVLAEGTRLRPVALVANNGRFEVRDANVTFRIQDAAGTRTLLEERVPVARMDGVTGRLVAPNKLSDALPSGLYVLTVAVEAPTNPRPPAPDQGVAAPAQVDANRDNNVLTLPFAVRTVRDVRAFVTVPADAIMTDVDAPKEGLTVRVENRGNTNASGVLNVTVHVFNETTQTLGPALETILTETILPAELPFGKDLSVDGSSENVATRTFSWTARAPGIYTLKAVFHDVSGTTVEAALQNVFVRRTPTSSLGPLAIPAMESPVFPDLHRGSTAQLCIDATRTNCFRSWGFAGYSVGNAQFQSNVCGTQQGEAGAVERPPLCPMYMTPFNLGTSDGTWAWVSTHDDRFVDVPNTHGTNILDEGILEKRIENFGPDLVAPGERLYLSFRHLGKFDWTQLDENFANPNGFRGQFRIVEDRGAAPDGPQRLEAPDEARPAARHVPQEPLLYSVNFTTTAMWDRVVLDLTPVIQKMKSGERKTVQFQWVAQTTPASITPDWRYGPTARDRPATSAPQECQTLNQLGMCTVFDPLERWALDGMMLFTSPPSADPVTEQPIWRNGAEPTDGPTTCQPAPPAGGSCVAFDFTDCGTWLNPVTGHSRADVATSNSAASAESATRKCRHWQREQHFSVPTMWHIDGTPGLSAPAVGGKDESFSIRWGNPFGPITDTDQLHQGARVNHFNDNSDGGFYTVLQTPRFSLAGTQTPALAFDEWHSFQAKETPVADIAGTGESVPYVTEGGNVWISGYDENGRRVLHELLFPAPESQAQYQAALPYHAKGLTFPVFRGVEPEWSENYTKMRNVKSAFAKFSGSGSEPQWQRATFDLTRYAQEELVNLTYAVEFHAFQYLGDAERSKGWRLDNIEVREGNVANDVALADIESPGSLVGPGVTQPVVIRVRNDGYFAQKAVKVDYAVYDASGDVVFGPVEATLPYGGPGDELPGRLQAERLDKNQTFPFPESWTPTEPGTYRIVARTLLAESLERMPDENPLNDRFEKIVEVKEHHDVFLHDGLAVPDEFAVTPFIGPVGEPRTLSFVVENNGTVPERFLGQTENLFRVEVDIVGEDGKSVLGQPFRQNLREVVPGQKVLVTFPDAWVPTASGVFRVVARLVYPTDDDGTSKDDLSDNVRVVKVLVFDMLVPQPGRNLTTEFVPDDLTLWGHNASRYATSDGWSYPPEFEYPPLTDTNLVLERVLNLNAVRSAFLRINQSFDFERGYDGGRVEVSLDGGRSWSPVAPVQKGGWEQMSTASPFVTDPKTPAYAWTGRGEGTWEINLGTLDGLHGTATLIEDDFEGTGMSQLRADLDHPDPVKPVPTPSGLKATFAPVETSDPHDIALTVVGRDAADAPKTIKQVWVQPNAEGNWYRMAAVSGTDQWQLRLPIELVEVVPTGTEFREGPPGAGMPAARKLPWIPNGSFLRFRAYHEGSLVPVESGVFEFRAGALVPQGAAREIAFRASPGQTVLWSDKSAVLCPASVWGAGRGFGSVATPAYPGTNLWEDPFTSVRGACRGYAANATASNPNGPNAVHKWTWKGPVKSTKFLQTTVDVTGAPQQGALRIDIRDMASLPPVFIDGGNGQRPALEQTVRVVVDVPTRVNNVPTTVQIVRDPLKLNPRDTDRYWNWTDRTIVFQGSEWTKILAADPDASGRKKITVRFEHVVSSASSKDVTDSPSNDFMTLQNTDEYGPNFGWGVASIDIQIATTRDAISLTRLDAAAMRPGEPVALPEGWRQGVYTEYRPTATSFVYGFLYNSASDVFEATSEPFTKGFWRPASAIEWERPFGDIQPRANGRLNRFWEANASRLPSEVAGGASRLVMPLDLKPAVGTTTMTFNTQYYFRDAGLVSSSTPRMGASGGRVEISIDDGASWIPLQPVDPAKAALPPTPHPGQLNVLGEPDIRPGVTYGRMFHNGGFGIANHFAGDSSVTVGHVSEFGVDPATSAFTLRKGTNAAFPGHPSFKFRDWYPAAFDLTPFAGRDVLIAFHATFTGNPASSYDRDFAEKRDFWRIDDLRVVGEVFQGTDVRIRLRTASDATVSGSGWDVRGLEVLSQKHLTNVGAAVVSPTADDLLHVGENPFVVEVSNRGIQDVRDVHVHVWVNATGPGAPPARHYAGPLSAFVACADEPIPSDSSLDRDRTLRLCGTVADGTFTFVASPNAKYEIKVFATHRDFSAESLVGDNLAARAIRGAQVVVRDRVEVERLTLLPSILDRSEARPVTVTATLALKGFDRADVASATLVITGDPDVPINMGLADARSLDLAFTEPGAPRALSWVVPRDVVDELRDGVYQARVEVFTAGDPVPSVAVAPMYKGASVRPTPGFLFMEDTDLATRIVAQGMFTQLPSPTNTVTIDTSGRFSSEPGTRSMQCTDFPRDQPHRWCVYHTAWNESHMADVPNPFLDGQGGENAAGDSQCFTTAFPCLSTWQRAPVMMTNNMPADQIPEPVKAHGPVFDLPGPWKNRCSGVQNANGQSSDCVHHDRAISLESPPIDVRGMGGAKGLRPIGVQFAERHEFLDQGAFAKVLIAPWSLGPQSENRNGYPLLYRGLEDNGWIEIGTLTGGSNGFSDFQFVTFSADAGAAIHRNWTRAVEEGALQLPENYDWVKVRIVLYLPKEASFGGFQVDDILVGPFVTTLGPVQVIPLSDDTDKTYTYFLENAGAFSDVVNVTLRKADGSRSLLPNGWNVTVLDEDGSILDQMGPAPAATDKCAPVTGERKQHIELAAGDVRRIRVKVCIPVTSGVPGRTGFAPIDIHSFSQKLPGLLAGSALQLDYSYLNRPNLKVASIRTNADVPVDQPRQVTVEVHNTGTLSACQATIGLVDRLEGEPDVEVFGASGVRPDVGACRRRPDGVLEGGLPPGEGRTFRFVWTPHGTGVHNITAVADPANVISELSEEDNALTQSIDVKLPSFPDVVARVTVSDDEPNIGDAVRVSLALTNTGGIAAQSVNVTMKVGVTDLLGGFNEGLVPRIGPGETVWLNKTWRAVFPGKVLLYVNALPRDGVLERVETQGNNLVVQPLFVRSQGLDVTAKVVGIEAAPGDARSIGFIISNNGDTPDSYDLSLDAPRGVRASIFLDGTKVESITLANRTSANLTAIVDLPTEFPAGDVELGLRAVSQNTTQTRVAQFTLSVKALYGFFLEASQAEAKPGRVEIPLSLTNLGNANDPYEVDVVNAPPGWKGVPTPGVVAPYAKTTAMLVMDVPTTTPRGIYEVVAKVRDRAGAEATTVVGVTLLDYQAAVPTFDVARTVVRPSTLVPATVALVNEGNVRAETAVRVEAPTGWRVEVDRPSLVLDPGEKAELALKVVVPEGAAFGTVGAVKLVTTSGGVDRVATLDIEVGESDLHVLELEYTPRVGLQVGAPVEFTTVVRNDGGLDARDVGVAFYVNDLLAGYETVGVLAAGGEATVSFRWSATAGEHVVLAILDPGDTVRETDEANNARLEVVRVARAVGILSAAREDVPGAGAMAVLAAVVAAAAVAAVARKRTR